MTKKFKDWRRNHNAKHVKWNTIRGTKKVIVFDDAIVIYDDHYAKKLKGEGIGISFESFSVDNIHRIHKKFEFWKFKQKIQNIRRGKD